MARFAIFFFTFFLLHHRVTSEVSKEEKKELDEEKTALLSFIGNVRLPPKSKYSWNKDQDVCKWSGVVCENEHVVNLVLPGASLVGKIPEGTIGKLVHLRVLSLRVNGLSGPLPEDFSNLRGLTRLHLNNNSLSGMLPEYISNFVSLKKLVLDNNKFSGNLPKDFSNLKELTELDLSNNSFSGPLPENFSNLKKLTKLVLSNNSFSGPLPEIDPGVLKVVDVSNNSFTGSIPKSYIDFPGSNFSMNNDLCGKPLKIACKDGTPSAPMKPEAQKSPKDKNKGNGVIVGVSVGSALLLLILLFFLKKKINKQSEQLSETPLPKSSRAGTSTEDQGNKLVFLDAGISSFELEDLYNGSSHILGKGSAGTSYKVVMDGGRTVVLKRLKDVVVTKMEFESRMEALGKMKHHHLISLQAFYYSEKEKSLVYDYFPAGSLFARLHGSRGPGRRVLDWSHRMRIALSAAMGVAYLHEAGKVVHGNIKSSNILLQQDQDEKNAFVTDFGLNTLFGPKHQVVGYLAPEVLEDQKLTFESDVYSFGVLVLELLTGKAPNETLVGGDLPRWVQHNTNIREEWKADVFDLELTRYQNMEIEMVQLLNIAMECVSTMPDQRPSMHEVVRKIEVMNQAELDDTSVDLSKGSDSHTPSTDSHTPSTQS